MHEQDDISAAQNPEKAYSRISGPVQNQERTGRAAPQAGQGPQAPGRLIYPPEHRLRRRGRFTACYDSGRKYFTRHFVVFALLRPADGVSARLGLTVGKKCGCAVARNRIKRVLREFFRLRCGRIGLPLDLVIVAKKTVSAVGFSLEAACRELDPLVDRLRKDFSRATGA
jgi:ribonuclease P protein component